MFAYGGFYKVIGGTVVSKTPMTLIAGLVGIEIDKKNRFMRPKIGWIVSESNHKNFAEKVTEGQELIASKIPEELKQIDYLPQICIQFINDFDIPEWLNTVKIDHIILRLYKKPTPKELKAKESLLRKICHDRDIHVNSNDYMNDCIISTKKSFAPDDYVYTLETLSGYERVHPSYYNEHQQYLDDCSSKAVNPNNLPDLRMIVEFIVEKDGSISNIKVKEDSNAHPEHYEEAKHIIMGMPKWKPAYIENKDGSKRYVRFKIKEIITVF